MKNVIYLFAAILAVALLAWFSPMRNPSHSPLFSAASGYPQADIFIKNLRFDGRIADTDARKEQGLGDLASIGDREAMLFPYDKPGSLPFWMKGMRFSIDIVWLDADLRVVHFERGVSPDSYPKLFSSDAPAQYVIELAAGSVDRVGLRIGDQIKISSK